MDNNISWFNQFNNSQTKNYLKQNPVVYFCSEFALTSSLPIYAGGLGVLAGDLLREASDRTFPIVGVGLYYNDGYATLHHVDQKGFIESPHVHRSPEYYGLEPVLDQNGKLITISIPIEAREVTVKAWRWQVGIIPVFLLDTDCEQNSPEDRKITDHLYVADRETRFKQEIILGIGGARMLAAFGVKPSIFHMNEGHSGLLAYEVIHNFMSDEKISFEEAVRKATRKIVFTNHTLVAGGQEVFNTDLVSLLLSDYAKEMGFPISTFLSLGKVQDASSFSLTYLSLNSTDLANAVSKIHAKTAKTLWPADDLIPITNGIHIPTWNTVNDDTLWQSHLENKRALIEAVHLAENQGWNETDLIVGWARRLVEYKRPMAILEDIPALKALIQDAGRPIRLVFSGSLHPSDIEGAKMLENFHNVIWKELAGYAAFISEYNLDNARLLTSGCDIWLNTPIVGFEACGTSGMKAALNGVLPLSTRDGWIDEIELLDKGWGIDNDNVNKSILGLLKNDILPLFYDRDESGTPQNWLRNMKNCRELIKTQFSATRMLREYIEKLYLPLLPAQ